jgi:hypothetical protein
MSIGQLQNSIVSGTNENTSALVNFNIDFSLLKLKRRKSLPVLEIP